MSSVSRKIGAVIAGFVAARIARLRQAIVVGVLLTLAGIANNLMLPPPLWFWVASVLVLLPAALLGASFTRPAGTQE